MPYGYPPDCPYGYYNYAPYACAPYGYYGPGWFTNGLFIGVGPWYGWGYRGWGPWYRRRRRPPTVGAAGTEPAGVDAGWGCAGGLLWIILIIAIIWLIAVASVPSRIVRVTPAR